MKNKTKLKIEGLFLWAVDIRWRHGREDTLWITTKEKRLVDAAIKAKRFLANNAKKYPEVEIVKIESQGTLDA